jgi:hypothetical protein
MKNFNKLFVGLILTFGMVAVVQATVGVRAPKASFTTPFSLSPSSVTAFTVLESTPAVIKKPGAVYQVIMGSGAASEFLVMFDSNSASGITSTLTTPNATQLGPRLFYQVGGSSNTVITFDPPLIFDNGLMVIDSAITGQATISFELGRGLSGN